MDKGRAAFWQYRWKDEVITAGLLLAFGFAINTGIQIRGLGTDDLQLWSCYRDQSFWEFVFPAGGTEFRPLFYLFSYLELRLVGNHVTWFVPVNIILNTGVAYTVCRFARRLSGNSLISFMCGFLYLLSRMSCFQIAQVYGLMETFALWAAIGILWCMYEYINEPGEGLPCFWGACGLYAAVCFIHERYMALLPLFYVVLAMKRSRRLREWLLPAAAFGLVQLTRLAVMGTVSPAGAGGTSVTGAFNLARSVKFAVCQVLYLFGINLGEPGLCGQSWHETARWVKVLVAGGDLVLLVFMATFVAKIIRSRWSRVRILKNSLLFFLFIGACIICSSVTVHLEARWIYVSMTGAWLWLSYMCGVIVRPSAREQEASEHRLPDYRRAVACIFLMLFYVILMFPVETYCRDRNSVLYFWNGQQQYNSLAEQTYEKYGDRLFGKKIYILRNDYKMTEFCADTFFKVFDRERKAEGTEVIFVDSIRDFGQVTNNMLILREDPEFHAYQDITEAVRDLKCEAVDGYYKDGWMDESAKVRVMAGETGVIHLRMMYPGVMEGHERSDIYMDGRLAAEVDIVDNITYLDLQTEPYHTAELEFENNFYLEDALEQRGAKRFSMIVEFTAD